MYRGYLLYAVLVLALFGYAQYRGWSLGDDETGGSSSRGGGWSWGSWGGSSGRGSSWGGGFHK